MTLRIVSKDAGHVIASFHPVLFAAFRRAPSDDELARIAELARQALAEGLRGSLLYVIARREMSGGVDPRVRAFFTKMIAENQDRSGPTAVVVLSDGFAAALVRGAVTGMVRLMRGRDRMRIFSSVPEACRWLAAEQQISSTALIAAWREAAAELGV